MKETPLYALVLTSETPPRTFPLTQEYIHIGRSRQNDIVIENPHISRIHARLIRQKDVYILEDLNSTNGTFLNERRVIHPVVLQPGDRIRLGPEVVLQFVGPEADLAPTVLAPVSEAESPDREGPTLIPAPPLSSPPTALATGTPGTLERPEPSVAAPAASSTPTEEAPPMSSGPASPAGREIVYAPQRGGMPWWLLGCLGVFSVACGVCAAWLWWVDANRLWCTYALFRWLLPGCP